ncbi:MAG: hypothetical protein PVF58_14295 [Candidatus Methanofastidiosia archaeon]|jgi:hypothetical protein
MTEYYCAPEEPFRLYRGDDEDVSFIAYTDRTMDTPLNITGADLYFTMRYDWDYEDYIIYLSTILGTITITGAVNGEFDLNFTGTHTTVHPGGYKYDITMQLAGDRSILRQDGVQILENITDLP